MSAKRRPVEQDPGGQIQPDDADGAQAALDGPDRGPESVRPWGTTGGTADRDAPWGAAEDSPMDEGSEETGLPPARRGERRADAQPPRPWPQDAGRHGFGTVEPTRAPEAGPGGAPDPAPRRRLFPDDTALDDLRNNPLWEETGMHSEGVSRHESLPPPTCVTGIRSIAVHLGGPGQPVRVSRLRRR
ncbi:hypothetical protein ABNF97_01315 [Plantactinospora sp. B6F1]|uniref:hypothetical protein n=1 Tax=Plantactinospora sp. B6F1 TaxID=3158971 RepID=UPI0032D927D4